MEISLDQTLAMALANNKDIESSRIDQLESDYTLTAAQGAYDPQLNVTSYWEQQITPIASALGGSSTGSLLNKTWQADPGITAAFALVRRNVQDGFIVRGRLFEQHLPLAESAV